MKRLSRRLTYANVMSSLALFLVLGGGAAFAANQVAKNSIGPKMIKNNAIGPAKIKAGAVTGDKLANGAVNALKLAPGAVSSDKLPDNAITAKKLANGSVGAGKLGAINTRTVSISVPKEEIKGTTVSCSPGEVLLAGGTSWNTTAPNQNVYTSESNKSSSTAWRAAGYNGAGVALTFNAFAYCLAP